MKKTDKVKTFSVYKKNTGEILKRVICSESDMHLQFDSSTEDVIHGFYDDKEYKVVEKELVKKTKKEKENG